MMNYSEAVYWLALINESGLKLNVIKPVIQRWCVAEKRKLADLFELSSLAAFGLAGNEAEQAMAILDKLAEQAAKLEAWQAEGIELVLRTDSRYPRRLAQTLPPATQPLVLWVRGSAGLLNEPAVAMLGGEEPDAAATQLMAELTQALAAEEIGLISGYGRGLDRATFEAMLHTENGHAVIMLPMGLSAFAKTTTRLDEAVETGRISLASPFSPDQPYNDKLAEARNLLIDHLALVMLIPQADDDSMPRAGQILARGAPIFVDLTDTANNRTLIDQGALLLTDTGEVVEMVQQAMIDAVLLEPTEEEGAAEPTPATTPPPPPATTTLSDADDRDFALRVEDVEPIDRDEALEILSMGGKIPDVLRKRLKEETEE